MKSGQFVLLLIAILGFANCNTSKDAAEPQPNEDRRANRMERMQQEYEELKAALALSPEQEEKFDAINSAYREKMMALRGSGDREQFQQMNNDRLVEIEEILSTEQMALYKAYITERQQARRNRRGGGK